MKPILDQNLIARRQLFRLVGGTIVAITLGEVAGCGGGGSSGGTAARTTSLDKVLQIDGASGQFRAGTMPQGEADTQSIVYLTTATIDSDGKTAVKIEPGADIDAVYIGIDGIDGYMEVTIQRGRFIDVFLIGLLLLRPDLLQLVGTRLTIRVGSRRAGKIYDNGKLVVDLEAPAPGIPGITGIWEGVETRRGINGGQVLWHVSICSQQKASEASSSFTALANGQLYHGSVDKYGHVEMVWSGGSTGANRFVLNLDFERKSMAGQTGDGSSLGDVTMTRVSEVCERFPNDGVEERDLYLQFDGQQLQWPDGRPAMQFDRSELSLRDKVILFPDGAAPDSGFYFTLADAGMPFILAPNEESDLPWLPSDWFMVQKRADGTIGKNYTNLSVKGRVARLTDATGEYLVGSFSGEAIYDIGYNISPVHRQVVGDFQFPIKRA